VPGDPSAPSRALKNAPRFSALPASSPESAAGKAGELAEGRAPQQPAERTIDVDASVRLDAFVHAALVPTSRRLVHALIAEGAVRVNGRRVAKGFRLRPGDRVTMPALPPGIVPEPGLTLPVVHEDDALVVVEKPGGMPSHALDPRERGSAAAFLVARYPEMAGVGDPLAPGLVHRLDTGTSGLLVAARTARAHAALRDALRRHVVEKRYLAVVAGRADRLDRRRVDAPLAHDPGDRRRMTTATAGRRAWPAATWLEVVTVAGDRSLVQATIRTGVTHQIRAHLAHLGHPVLGDVIYGGASTDLAPGRHALHAAALALPHPVERRTLRLEAALPRDLRALIDPA
jgi:23S rRNA pseudouridine1911/1915/1917 synthase